MGKFKVVVLPNADRQMIVPRTRKRCSNYWCVTCRSFSFTLLLFVHMCSSFNANNSGREYHTMTLRGLYDYVIRAITKRSKVERDSMTVSDIQSSQVRTRHASYGSAEDLKQSSSPSPPSAGGDFSLSPIPEQRVTMHAAPVQDQSIHFPPPLPPLSPQSSPSLLGINPQTDRSSSVRSILSAESEGQGVVNQNNQGTLTIRERLGGYLHPRDMRRLVTPFSSSNEPELMVRRHVMLLNFDPLRAIVLRDRMLLLVPDGADSILMNLERRVRGGIDEMEKQVFGEIPSSLEAEIASSVDNDLGSNSNGIIQQSFDSETKDGDNNGSKNDNELSFLVSSDEENSKQTEDDDDISYEDDKLGQKQETAEGSENHEKNDSVQTAYSDEWEEFEEFEGGDWIELAFELQSVDAVLSSVLKMLSDDSKFLRKKIFSVMEEMRDDSISAVPGDHVQEQLRILKDKVREMEGRVQGLVRAMNQILDDEEDMALMNLSRLISHPERFIQPVSQEVLNEESDEPELILEVYLQQALSEVNALNLLRGNIINTEELVSLQMDIVRNRLLYINTVVSVISLTVASASLVGSIFGMNLTNHLENDDTAFTEVVAGTLVGMVCMLILILVLISRSGVMPANPRKVLRDPRKVFYSKRRIDSVR